MGMPIGGVVTRPRASRSGIGGGLVVAGRGGSGVPIAGVVAAVRIGGGVVGGLRIEGIDSGAVGGRVRGIGGCVDAGRAGVTGEPVDGVVVAGLPEPGGRDAPSDTSIKITSRRDPPQAWRPAAVRVYPMCRDG
jgi:hypothetical protein